MVRGNGGLWRRIGRQTLWGRRGLMKTGTLWLPVAAALSFMSAGGLRGACVAGLALFAASALRTMGPYWPTTCAIAPRTPPRPRSAGSSNCRAPSR